MFELASSSAGAVFSDCTSYRYCLWRRWDGQLPTMVWVLLNPSTADASLDDPTVLRCVRFARAHQHGGVILVNLFAWRATDPRELRQQRDPVGPDNDVYIDWACRVSALNTIVAGWGAHAFAAQRAQDVRDLIACASKRPIQCFGTSKAGHPRHPLYLSSDSELVSL